MRARSAICAFKKNILLFIEKTLAALTREMN